MDINRLMQQAQKMQRNMEKAKQELEAKVYEVESNGGIKVTITGAKEITKIDFDAEMCNKDDKEMLQDLIIIAVNKAIKLVVDEEEKMMSAQTSGIKMPGMF